METKKSHDLPGQIGLAIFSIIGALAIAGVCYYFLGFASDPSAKPSSGASERTKPANPLLSEEWAPAVGRPLVKEAIVVLPAQYKRFEFEIFEAANVELVLARRTGGQRGISAQIFERVVGSGPIPGLGSSKTNGGLWDARLEPGKYVLVIQNTDFRSDPLGAEVSLVAH